MGTCSGNCEERERDGFSLVELAIVMVVLSIVAVAAFPTVNGALSEARLSAAAGEVVTALEYARLSAMTSGRTTRVEIHAATDIIRVRQYEVSADLFGGGDQLAEGVVESGIYRLLQYPMKRGSDYEIFLNSEDRFGGVDITASDFNVGAGVDFDALGSPSKGGTATLVLGSGQMVVTLDALTGKVTVSD
jgi:prepilin-type N-terminal cleavage/methylation domain-containing protein